VGNWRKQNKTLSEDNLKLTMSFKSLEAELKVLRDQLQQKVQDISEEDVSKKLIESLESQIKLLDKN